ncbi:uncharacterized protein LOC17900525 isoform X2 [Capsella rubella]|uniref:uncharacterized protein LOC17900525 isoform X2 n=1 Tax=Capsella rubella TaxID=81985 RepID=UPI000CD53B5C|nr:uncharacterized protein LOC17900525 isoform X2 [Capsella rubella]
MGIFPGFSLINQNTRHSLQRSSNKSGNNVKPKSVSETYPEDREELKKQLKLWRASEKRGAWHDYPPKVKEHRSSKVFSDLGPTEKHVKVEKAAPWRFLWWSGSIPVHLTFNESRQDFSAIYMIPKENAMFMKTLYGKWKIEPWYIDNSRYCKPRLPKNRQEYRQCTGGKGLIGSKVTLMQSFQPSSYLNFPPLSWYIRRVTIKTTKALVEEFQVRAAIIKSV